MRSPLWARPGARDEAQGLEQVWLGGPDVSGQAPRRPRREPLAANGRAPGLLLPVLNKPCPASPRAHPRDVVSESGSWGGCRDPHQGP